MKIYRLLGILTTLLQNEKVTAPYLAEKFEVSRRTINRDINDLCKAGIPIVTTQGYAGGISIAEGYKIDKTVFTKEEIEDIFIALKGLNSISHSSQYERIIEKLEPSQKIFSLNENILIDLSSFYKGTLAPKIELIKNSISDRKLISFTYYYSKGETKRIIEPNLVVFKWSSWYVFGYCLEKQGFRLFKLNRLWNLHALDKYYKPREINDEETNFDNYFTDEIALVAKFDASVKYRLIEDYGVKCFSTEQDGRLLFKWGFTNKQDLISWILGFGSRVEVIKPQEIRDAIIEEATKMLKIY